MRSSKYEVILAIVNEGMADDVMDVARECGVRGGTILTARGVTNEEAAAFFGISIHSEKEILMMVVEKAIKNNVLNAIYDKLEMSKKTKGIVFSLPVSAAAGLVGQDEE
ncbi:MAG: P-II family nitrogen regulator [Clostridia bacterium]|nr:P-II family nitrogen regulator [Clostridia bacterium]